MNQAQEAELQELSNLDQSTLEEGQKARLSELTEIKSLSEKAKGFDSAIAQKDHFREKAEKAEAERIALEQKLNDAMKAPGASKSLEVNDFIDISASLDGLDQREKEFLANQHKLTGKPLSDIRKDEDFLLWQGAHRAKVEKERSVIPPSGKQPDSDAPVSLEQALSDAKGMDEKEAILKEHAGYSVGTRQRTDRVIIGGK